MPTIEVSVDLNDFDDDEIIEELESRGYQCSKDEVISDMDREEYLYLIEMIDKMPFNWYTNRIRDKLFTARHKESS